MQPRNKTDPTLANRRSLAKLGWMLGWMWTIVAGGGGLWLLATKGP